ncbi:MAG: hypothetical protein JST58_13205 [Bacteroidetes bacterium]|nr:hypothetical protein [Bacteroidota bacterium]
MKKVLFACLFFSQGGMAQWKSSDPLFKSDRFEVPKPMNTPFGFSETTTLPQSHFYYFKDTAIKINPDDFPNELLLNRQSSTPRSFLGKTDLGTVYTMSPDNMPCLLPELSNMERMPVRGYKMYMQDDIDRMPNPLAQKKLQPKNQKRSNHK